MKKRYFVYSQVQGDNMKNRTLFMMFTLLGAPGFVTAGGSDLAGSEYNFAVNELSKSSYNQAAIIGQQGSGNSTDIRQDGSKLMSVVSQEGEATERRLINQELITLLISIKMEMVMTRVLSRTLLVIPQ